LPTVSIGEKQAADIFGSSFDGVNDKISSKGKEHQFIVHDSKINPY
jgi:hypothetical protein